MRKLSVTLMVYLLMISTGQAEKGDRGDFKQVIELQPTIYAKRFFTKGRAAIGQHNGIQFFGVRMTTNLEDGTIF